MDNRHQLSTPSCALTLMRCADGKRAHKVFFVDDDGVVDKRREEPGAHFVSREVPVSGLDELHSRLVALEGARGHFVVRGKLREGKDGSKPHRRWSNLDKHGEATTYTDADRRWLMLDIDGLKWPPMGGVDAGDGELVARMIRMMLPPAFADAGCVWQWSGSAGVGGWSSVKMHLWFWLDRAVCSASWRQWWERHGHGLVDLAPMQAVQAHYTASPTFEDGLEDPVGQRTGLVAGPVVRVPRAVVDVATFERRAARELAERKARAANLRRGENMNDSKGRAYARAALRRACEAVEAAGEGMRHATLRDESLATARFVRDHFLSKWEWRTALTAAGQVALPKGRWCEIERLLDGALELDGARGAA